ncbi:MAG: hypothetical protein KJO29_10030 [Bacteroidia bacterium]|nr:hypothetical protein [Bacteroidia bacterium]
MKQLTILLLIFVGMLPACSQQSKEIHFKGEMARKAIQIGNFYIDPSEDLTPEAQARRKKLEDHISKMDKASIEEQTNDPMYAHYKSIREAGLDNLPMIHLVDEKGLLKTAYVEKEIYKDLKTYDNNYLKAHVVELDFTGKEITVGEESSVYLINKVNKIDVKKGSSKFFK